MLGLQLCSILDSFCLRYALSSIWIGIWGLILAVLAGIFKEVYDYLDYGKYDICDMLATWIGAIAGDLVVQLGQALFL